MQRSIYQGWLFFSFSSTVVAVKGTPFYSFSYEFIEKLEEKQTENQRQADSSICR